MSTTDKVITPEELDKRMDEAEKKYQNVEGTWKCRVCGSNILALEVSHSIWNGTFPMCGSGECYVENVPYCPVCDKDNMPNIPGDPIAPKGSYHNP